MFLHNFKYTLKTLFKNKMLIFWTYAFPVILGTFFYLAFSDIENSEKLSIVDIAIVDNKNFKNDTAYTETFKELSDKNNEDRLFNIKYVSENDAKTLLKNDEITGYLILDESPKIYVKESGINQTVFKSVVEEIDSTKKMINTLSEKQMKNNLSEPNIDYNLIYNNVINTINNSKANIKDASSSNLSYTMIEFYTLIAMSALYGGILALVAINNILPNMTSVGKRVNVSSLSKLKLILSSVLASYIVQIIGLGILFIYTIFALRVDYGNNLPLIILLSLVGSLAGLSLGTFIASALKTNDNAKTGILISFTMFGCFLSGMFGITMKYIIDKNVPILNKINPVNMITDGLYSLYYYDTFDRFYFNVISLIIFSILMITLSFSSLRRQKYDSI